MRSGSAAVIGLLGLGLAACCTAPWKAFPSAVPPDRTCRAGNPAGYDLFIWECREGQRVVVYKWSGEMSCREPKRETAACGELTPIERELGESAGVGCKPVPREIGWR